MSPVLTSKVRSIALLALAPLALFLAAWVHEPVWDWLGIIHMKPYFVDTVALLSAGEAKEAGRDVYAAPNPFDPYGRPHVYGPWWLWLGKTGAKVGDGNWLGVLVMAAFVVTAAAAIAPEGIVGALLAALLLASPPVLLGLERGNNDLIVFVLLAVSAWALSRPRPGLGLLGCGLLGLAGLLKFYSLAALPMLAARAGRWRTAVSGLGLIVVVCGVVFWLWREDYGSALERAPRPETIFAYGLPLVSFCWRVLAAWRGWLVLGALLGAGGVLLLFGRRLGKLWVLVPSTGISALCFIGGAASWVLCYVGTTNYPYRLVWLLLPCRLWLELRKDPAAGEAARWQLAGWIIVAWLAVPKHWWAAVMEAGGAPGLVAPYVTFIGFEQGCVFTLTALLGWNLLGWAVRRIREEMRTPPVGAEPR